MSASAELPSGLRVRTLAFPDAEAVFQLFAAQELADLGEVTWELADLVGDWQRPSFDLATSSAGVFSGERLVGYVELTGPTWGMAAVHPEFRGRGIGTWLAGQMQAMARRCGSEIVGMPVPEGSPGDKLLAALGYFVRWTSWQLELPPGAVAHPRELPAGYAIRPAEPSQYRACWTVQEDAFLEWSVRERQSFEDYAAQVMERPGFEPWNFRVALAPGDEVVGVALVRQNGHDACLDKLSVRKDHRSRGLAQSLITEAFDVAREHGCTRFELSTDSRTGALGLYEKVGMQVTRTWLHRAIPLR